MTHPLADLFVGADDVAAAIAARDADTTDHLRTTRETVDALHPRRLHLVVSDVVVETPTTRTFRLRRPDGTDLPPFLAGQYVAVLVDGTSRAYAISSSPHTLDHYDLTIRRVPGGRISNLLLDTVRVGDPLTTTGPVGTFFHNPLFHGDDVVFVAGGSGVAPAMSMIRDVVDSGLDRRLTLVYGTRDTDDVIFRDEIDRLAADHPGITAHLVVQHPDDGWTGPRGFVTADLLTALLGDLDGRTVYVCGPQAFYPHVLRELTALGHPRHRVRFEANGAPADPTARPTWPVDVPGGAEVSVTTRERTFRTRRDRPLLDALEDEGVAVEAVCRSGECSECRVRVLAGDVHSADEARMRMSDARSGYVHACVAYPLSDVVLDV